MRILVTGVAGFIGMHVALRLLKDGHEVAGLDNMNQYYDVKLKLARLEQIGNGYNYTFHKLDLADGDGVNALFSEFRPEIIINLAAQAGVRYSLKNPHSYIESNIVGFVNVLEACKKYGAAHLVYASSSSVYGLSCQMPFNETQITDHPASLYGATKKANELLAHSYSHLFGLPTTGLRFFTVYGPWGRPDMAPMIFAEAILKNKTIDVFNEGKMKRDFTFIDDVVEGLVSISMLPPSIEGNYEKDQIIHVDKKIPWRVLNIGNGAPVGLEDFVSELELALGKKAKKNYAAMQPGDVVETFADTTRLEQLIGFRPKVDIRTGINSFVQWFKNYSDPSKVFFD